MDFSSLNPIRAIIDSLGQITTLDELQSQYRHVLGKTGLLSKALKEVGSMEPTKRQSFGQQVNQLKEEATQLFKDHQEQLQKKALDNRLANEEIDITLPGRTITIGKLHPITHVINHLLNYFSSQGFEIQDGPHIETPYYNFDALNIPPHHPARQSHDTFYLKEPGYLLRTHTSNVQIRTMEKSKPPFRFVSCGRVYRSDYDATHTPMFHQLEGMVVGHDTSFAHLKGLMIDFCEDFFGLKNLPVRFRPSFFPFTEPSAEVDIGYSKKENEMVIGGNDYWMEILGCGMVHPNVLEGCGIDPNIYQGIAFGIGIERLVMLKYGFSDIRQLYSGDFHWISSCGFYPTSPL